ncbi:MAG TPA: hypothetical protein PKE65_02115 [Rhizobiaceae bacterium]|nr:hypothetical protein [Rhizobiaceae bacterium]
MQRAILAVSLALLSTGSALADSKGHNRSGGRLDAIAQGRIYDRLLTPQLNPGFSFAPGTDEQARRSMRLRGDERPPRASGRNWFFRQGRE